MASWEGSRDLFSGLRIGVVAWKVLEGFQRDESYLFKVLANRNAKFRSKVLRFFVLCHGQFLTQVPNALFDWVNLHGSLTAVM